MYCAVELRFQTQVIFLDLTNSDTVISKVSRQSLIHVRKFPDDCLGAVI